MGDVVLLMYEVDDFPDDVVSMDLIEMVLRLEDVGS